MALEVVARTRRATILRDSDWPANRRRIELTNADQHYQDAQGDWQPIVEAFEADGADGFAQRADKLRHMVRVGDNGGRRWYPRRNVPGEFVEFGRPEYWTGTQWTALPLGPPTRTGNVIVWDRPNFTLTVTLTWRRFKLDLVLKSAAAARRLRWPVSLTGLSRTGYGLTGQDGQAVGRLDPLVGTDANGVEVPIVTSLAGGFVEFTADLTGLTFPVAIDPTLTTQPDATAGKDTTISVNTSTHAQDAYNYGIVNAMHIGNRNNNAVMVYRALIQFDLTSIPSGSTINSAALTLCIGYDFSDNSRAFRVYRLKRAWLEGTGANNLDSPATGATWLRYDLTNTWQTAGAFGANDCEQTDIGSRTLGATETVGAFLDWTLTPAAVQAMIPGGVWANNGFLLKADVETLDSYGFWSSDHATAVNRPKLVIDYTEPVSASMPRRPLARGVPANRRVA